MLPSSFRLYSSTFNKSSTFPRGTPFTSFQFLRYLWSSITREFQKAISVRLNLCTCLRPSIFAFVMRLYKLYMYIEIIISIMVIYRWICSFFLYFQYDFIFFKGSSLKRYYNRWKRFLLIKIKSWKWNNSKTILMALPLSEKFSSDT